METNVSAEDERLQWIRNKVEHHLSVGRADVEWLLIQYDALSKTYNDLVAESRTLDREVERAHTAATSSRWNRLLTRLLRRSMNRG